MIIQIMRDNVKEMRMLRETQEERVQRLARDIVEATKNGSFHSASQLATLITRQAQEIEFMKREEDRMTALIGIYDRSQPTKA